jgi:hypothetical protein
MYPGWRTGTPVVACSAFPMNATDGWLIQDQPWSIAGWRFICKQCGAGKIVMRGADKEDMAAA